MMSIFFLLAAFVALNVIAGGIVALVIFLNKR